LLRRFVYEGMTEEMSTCQDISVSIFMGNNPENMDWA
jgi:hypothetical protein